MQQSIFKTEIIYPDEWQEIIFSYERIKKETRKLILFSMILLFSCFLRGVEIYVESLSIFRVVGYFFYRIFVDFIPYFGNCFNFYNLTSFFPVRILSV